MRPTRSTIPTAGCRPLGEVDLHLIGEGRHEQLWDVLGAHERTYDTPQGPVSGTSFAVWAPNARGVRIVGDFDYWSGRDYPMRSLGSSGVWELFVPGVGKWAKYKFNILGADSVWRQKADPMAFATEAPPANGLDGVHLRLRVGRRRVARRPGRNPMAFVAHVHL